MTLDKYLSLVAQHSLEYDRTFALRSYQEYIKSSSADEHIDIHQYIQQYLPPEDMVNLSSVLGTSYSPEHLLHITKAQKWLQRNCEPYIATLCGVYITTATAQTLREFLCNTIPVMDVFKTLCSELAITFTQALFENYCQKNKTQLSYTRYHPFYSDKWFWTGKIDDLHTSIRQWYMLYSANIPSDIDGFASLMDAANMLSLGPEQLLTWLLTHPTAYQCHNNRCYINISTIDNLSCRWKDVYKVQPIVNKKLSQIPIKARPGAKQMLLCWLENSNHDWLLPAGFFPQQLENILYTDQLSAASCALDMCLNTYPTRQLSCLKDVTGMPLKKLQEKASSGSIIAFKDDNGNWYISENEYKRVATAQEQHISLDNIILSLLNEINSNYDLSSHVKRNHLMNYCNDHNWWELEYTSCDMLPIDGQRFGIAIAAESVDFLKEKLDLWLKGYGQTYDYKFGLIINKFSHSLPDTAKQLINFEKQVHPADKALVDTAEHLCSILQTDIQKPDDPKIESTIIEPFAQNASLVSCEILTEFLMFAGYNTKRQFHFPKSGRLMETSAYPVNDFAIMMAHIVNDDVIRGKKLIQKAIANKRHADLWLYVAVHMFASWRNTDYRQMIPPKLPYPPTEVLQKISDGEISPAELKTIAEYFIATNSLALDVPNKTKGTTAVPNLYFYCPRSCLESFGTILAITAAHYQMSSNTGTYVNHVNHWTVIKQFFGDEFLAACGNWSFRGRRANKSLLQCIEYAGRENENLPPTAAYHLASIVRSHKLSYGKLSETTDIYLKDAAFSNLTPEYVAYQMWERGVCSFVTDTMLKICYGSKYKALSVSQQTEVIKSVNLSPLQTTSILQYVQEAEDRACEIIQSVCPSDKSVEDALKTIALGYGKNKDQYGYCLCKAAGKDCEYKDRLNCLGCRYEIRTKALMLRYASIHYQMLQDRADANDAEKARLMYLCKAVTYPAMQEILHHLDSDAKEEYLLYKDLTQEAMIYRTASHCLPRKLFL